MPTYNLYDARNALSELVERAVKGEEVVIARRNQPAVRLVPIQEPARPKRQFGRYKGMFEIPDSFFDPLPDEETEGLG